MEVKYIDTHSHLYEKRFDADRDTVLARMRGHGVGTLAVGVSLTTSKQAVALAKEHEEVLGAVIGVHPSDTNEEFIASEYEPLLHSGVVVGVGECGLDYYRGNKESDYVRQREVFEAQIRFALDTNLPLMLHVRASEGSEDAHEDTLEILRTYQKEHGADLRGNSHFFTGSKDIARAYLELGFYISFPGVITFAPELHEVVRDVPLDMMLAETDSPYAAPVPHRGKRNEPVFVVDTIKAIAEIRGEEEAAVAAQLRANVGHVFGV